MPAPGIAIAGCDGRMGRVLMQLVVATKELTLAGGFEHPGHDRAGAETEIGGHRFRIGRNFGDIVRKTDILIDFTRPAATLNHLDICRNHQTAMVIGTTGFTAEQERRISAAASHIPIVKSGNMSLGVNLLEMLVEQVAARLDDNFDIEIHETHHRRKQDAPSGTALMLGGAAAAGRGISLEACAIRQRDGITGARGRGDIGFSVSRAGGIIGDHAVAFGSDEEVITLTHRALDRALFARGALAAAKWLTGRAPGLYSMKDVLAP